MSCGRDFGHTDCSIRGPRLNSKRRLEHTDKRLLAPTPVPTSPRVFNYLWLEVEAQLLRITPVRSSSGPRRHASRARPFMWRKCVCPLSLAIAVNNCSAIATNSSAVLA